MCNLASYLMRNCCPFSVLVRLILHEVSGGWKDYRNSGALKKAIVKHALLRFRGCQFSNLVEGAPFRAHC